MSDGISLLPYPRQPYHRHTSTSDSIGYGPATDAPYTDASSTTFAPSDTFDDRSYKGAGSSVNLEKTATFQAKQIGQFKPWHVAWIFCEVVMAFAPLAFIGKVSST
jgi:hypothetical protein